MSQQEANANAGEVDTINTTGVTLTSVNCRGYIEGSSIYVRSKSTYYILEFNQSNVIDHDLYETALGIPGAQWIKFVGGGSAGITSAPLMGVGSVGNPFTIDPTKLAGGLSISGGVLTEAPCPIVLVETKVIAVETNLITFSGLSGDADGIYEFRFDCIGGSTSTLSAACSLQPNALTTNLFSQGQFTQGLGTSTATSTLGSNTLAYISLGGAASQSWTAGGTIFPKSGKQRAYTVAFTQWDSATAGTRTGNMSGFWSDTSTAITSLQFFSALKMFGVGSVCSLWKRST